MNINYIRQQRDMVKALREGVIEAKRNYQSILRSNNRRIAKILKELKTNK